MITTIETTFTGWLTDAKNRLASVGIGGFAFNTIWNLFLCFFGYRFYRFAITACGFLLGGVGSYALLGAYTQIEDPVKLIVAIVIGAAVAVIAYVLYKVGVFLLVGVSVFFTLFAVLGETSINDTTLVIVALIFGLACAILSVKFMKPLIIVSTGLAGGQGTVQAVCGILGVTSSTALMILGIAVGALGIWFQFKNDKRMK